MARVIYFRPSRATDSDGGWRSTSYEPLNSNVERGWNGDVSSATGPNNWGTNTAGTSSVYYHDWVQETGYDAKTMWNNYGNVSFIDHCTWGSYPTGGVITAVVFISQAYFSGSSSNPSYSSVGNSIMNHSITSSGSNLSGWGRRYLGSLYLSSLDYDYNTVFDNSNLPSEQFKNFSLGITVTDQHSLFLGMPTLSFTTWRVDEIGAFAIIGMPVRVNSVSGGQLIEGGLLAIPQYEDPVEYVFKPDAGYDVSDYDITYHKGDSDCLNFINYYDPDGNGQLCLWVSMLGIKPLDFSVRFNLKNYKISYNLKSTSDYPVDNITNETSYTIKSDTITLNNPTRKGYTFLGWTEDGVTSSPSTTMTIPSGSMGNKSFTAHWQPNLINFQHWSNNGSSNYRFTTTVVTPSQGLPYSHTDYTSPSEFLYQTYIGFKGTGYYYTKDNNGNKMQRIKQDYSFNNYLQICDTYGINYYTQNSTIDIYCEWEALPLVSYDTILNYFDWYRREIPNRSNCSISNITDIGFTVTSNSNVSEGTSTSPIFKAEAGKKYKIDIDITGNNWDVYIFFQNESGVWLGTDSNSRFSSNGHNSSRIFEAPTGTVQATIRVDANGSNNTVRFENFRIYPADYYYMGKTISAEKAVDRVDAGEWSLPSSVVRNDDFWDFIGWSEDPSPNGRKNLYDTSNAFPTQDVVLYSQWKQRAPRAFVYDQTLNGWKSIPRMKLGNKEIKKAFVYTIPGNGDLGQWKSI